MLYKIGDSEEFFYEAYKRTSGIVIYCVVRKPDGTKVSLGNAVELDSGLDPITQGIYSKQVTFDQDGKWLMLFDAINVAYRRPLIAQAVVNTTLVNQINKINSASEIDSLLTLNHGNGSWQALTTLPDLESQIQFQ